MSSSPSNQQTIIFMVVLSLICATILSLLASMLAAPQEVARNLYRSKQMLVAAQMLNLDTNELQIEKDGHYVPAHKDASGRLVEGSSGHPASEEEIFKIYDQQFRPLLVDDQGKVHTFEEAHLNLDTYLAEHRKEGFAKLPYKLVYAIMPAGESENQEKKAEPIGYVIPINGMGLWNVIYGYLALAPDGNRVLGISWYEHAETPGLGGNISESSWQQFFPGKQIFQARSDGKIDPKTAELGIVVVKGKVSEVYGDLPKAKSAVDGMAGATLTGNGVTDAYRDVLSAYRPFLIQLYEKQHSQDQKQQDQKQEKGSLQGGSHGRS